MATYCNTHSSTGSCIRRDSIIGGVSGSTDETEQEHSVLMLHFLRS